MSPVVLESPVMNFHQNNINSISRMQLSPIHSPTLDAFPQDPLHLHPSLRPSNGNPLRFSPPIMESTSLNGGSTSLLNTPDSSAAATHCANCNVAKTPQWRRDGDGKLICNACGESSLQPSLFFRLRKMHLDCFLYTAKADPHVFALRLCVCCNGCDVQHCRVVSLRLALASF